MRMIVLALISAALVAEDEHTRAVAQAGAAYQAAVVAWSERLEPSGGLPDDIADAALAGARTEILAYREVVAAMCTARVPDAAKAQATTRQSLADIEVAMRRLSKLRVLEIRAARAAKP